MGEAGRAGYRRSDARGRGHRIGWTREAGRTGHGAREVVHEGIGGGTRAPKTHKAGEWDTRGWDAQG